MKTHKRKRITSKIMGAQADLLWEIARIRGITKQQALFEAIQGYTWEFIQERAKELKRRKKEMKLK